MGIKSRKFLDQFVRTSGDLVLVPLRGEDTSTLGVEVFPVGRTAPLENTTSAVVVYVPIAHEVGATVNLLWSWVSGSHRCGSNHHAYKNLSRDVHRRVEIAP